MEKGKYFLAKKGEHNYSPELENCIVDACQYCIDNTFGSDEEKQKKPIMMYGMIQSGKTRAFTGLIALAFDNAFDMVFILTKKSKPLVEQTELRMQKEFESFIEDDEIEAKDIMKINYLSGYQLDKKLIVIVKKEKTNLEKLMTLIQEYSIHQKKRTIIIDDEADTAGFGFDKVKNTDTFDLRVVASKINDIRGNLDGCVFVQVTATPYALYQQPEFELSDKLEPIKPEKTVLVPAGEGYIGGDYYFIKSKEENHPAQFLFQPIDTKEHEIVSSQKRKSKKSRAKKKSKIEDKRTFVKENLLIEEDTLPMFKKGIINFFVGAIALREIQLKKQKYAYVIHTATDKDNHHNLNDVAEFFLSQIKERNNLTTPKIEKLLEVSYEDIRKSITAYEFSMPIYQIVRAKFYEAIDKGYYRIDVVNSDTDVLNLLNKKTGELSLSTPFSIFIGGQVLDRGVTIHNLIGFYYGRNPVTMQQDTVLQHSRMFGYRSKELLSVTRFYTTKRIHSNMSKMIEIDNELRNDIAMGKIKNGIYFITQKEQDPSLNMPGRMIACSPAKIRVSDVILLKPHKRILPVGFTPIDKTTSIKLDLKINELLKSINVDETTDGKLIEIKKIEELIYLIYKIIKKDDDSTRFVDEKEIIAIINYLSNNDQKIPVIIRKDRTLSKYRQSGNTTVLSDAPDTPQPYHLAMTFATNLPVIMLIHEKGETEDWKESEDGKRARGSERPFWWPILVVPKNTHGALYASKLPGEKIRDEN